MEKTKIILLSGFLGSGKTTLLKHILSLDADMSDTVILMNEFGEVGIDGLMLKKIGTDVVELTSGCICCSMSEDLIESLEEILARFAPRFIIIEATGVADPESVKSVMKNTDITDRIELHKTITVMDAECWKVRDVFGTLFYRQLQQADTIVFNKIDLLEKDAIPRYLEEIHRVVPGSQVIPALNCRVEPEIVWSRPALHAGQPLFIAPGNPCTCRESGVCELHGQTLATGGGAGIYADTNFVSFSFNETTPLDETAFNRFVREMPLELFRMKGTVNFGDRTVMINSVGGKTGWEPWEHAARTQLAFVGWDIDPEYFTAKLKACVQS